MPDRDLRTAAFRARRRHLRAKKSPSLRAPGLQRDHGPRVAGGGRLVVFSFSAPPVAGARGALHRAEAAETAQQLDQLPAALSANFPGAGCAGILIVDGHGAVAHDAKSGRHP